MLQPLFRLLVVLVLLWGLAPTAVVAQPAAPSSSASTEELASMVATLRDPAAREQLIRQLELLIELRRTEDQVPARGFLSQALQEVGSRAASLGDRLSDIGSSFARTGSFLPWLERQIAEPDRRALWGRILVQLAVVFLAPALLWWGARRLMVWPIRRLDRWYDARWWWRLPVWTLRTLLELVPIAVFMGGAYAALVLLKPDQVTRAIVITLVGGTVLAWSILVLVRSIVDPLSTRGRLVPLSDSLAAYLYVWARRLVAVSVYSFFVIEVLAVLGLPAPGVDALRKLTGLIVAGLLVVLVLQNRQGVKSWIGGALGEGVVVSFRQRLAEVWHILAILYLLGAYTIWLLEIADGFRFVATATVRTFVIAIAAWGLMTGLDRAVGLLFRVSRDLQDRYPLLEHSANRYLSILQRALRIIIAVVALLLILDSWHVRLLSLLATGRGADVVSRGFSIVLIIVLATLAWELGSAALDRLLARSPGGASASGSRLRTIHPLARNALFVVVLLVSAIAILSELGVNVAPLLAGAGVVGLAIGFGAQTLVKDVITGAFIVFENSIGLGDVVTVAGRTGTIEAISIRTIRVRDAQGTIHTIPFSAVDTVTNQTRDFSNVVVEVSVAHRENVDRVFDILRSIGEAMRSAPDFAVDMLEPLEVLGIDRITDTAVVLQVKLKTAPGRQWVVRREFVLRMKRAFDAEGIAVPMPQSVVYYRGSEGLPSPP
ncbi:MAG: mechanosensitive ion channel [Alphaproteobacteria bacterium]|nr:mechanosensitive ion channel [Alphaproteobacteria bacterium]